jgi:hypothetical protein
MFTMNLRYDDGVCKLFLKHASVVFILILNVTGVSYIGYSCVINRSASRDS